jgi:hypothetical protein
VLALDASSAPALAARAGASGAGEAASASGPRFRALSVRPLSWAFAALAWLGPGALRPRAAVAIDKAPAFDASSASVPAARAGASGASCEASAWGSGVPPVGAFPAFVASVVPVLAACAGAFVASWPASVWVASAGGSAEALGAQGDASGIGAAALLADAAAVCAGLGARFDGRDWDVASFAKPAAADDLADLVAPEAGGAPSGAGVVPWAALPAAATSLDDSLRAGAPGAGACGPRAGAARAAAWAMTDENGAASADGAAVLAGPGAGPIKSAMVVARAAALLRIMTLSLR